MKYVIWCLVLLLVVLHQDNWFWKSEALVFGFLPVALFFHACISLAAGVTWYLATVFCWPHELEHAPYVAPPPQGEAAKEEPRE